MPRLSFGRFLRDYFVYLMPTAFIVYLVLETYQIDFRPYYTAGKAILLGLDPYLNQVTLHPEFYTPVNANAAPWSGFIYPPFAALLFVPLGLLPYVTAKTVYSVFVIACLWLLLYELVRQSDQPISGGAVLMVMASFPVLANFERGQLDIPVVYLTVLAFWSVRRSGKSNLAALLLAVACCAKVFPTIALIYFLIQRQYRLVVKTLVGILVLMVGPIGYFGPSVYSNYLKRILPEFFGALVAPGPIDVHGQSVVNRVVLAIEGDKLRVTHDFVNGYMNPFLRSSPLLSVSIGLVGLGILLYFLKGQPAEHRFFSALSTILIANPQTWIMGLVWFVPLFLYWFDRANWAGKLCLMLPIFMPPFTNSNAMIAYAVTLAFAIPSARKRLLEPSVERAAAPVIA
jgi:Glycosyltransferase family 87